MRFGIVYAFVFLFLLGSFASATNTAQMGCKNLYWINNENKSCSQQEFCGAYMYYGLQTFETKDECLNAVNISECNADSDCACGVLKSNGDCAVGNKDFINTSKQCPDFCRGFAGNMVLNCVSNKCVQIAVDKNTIDNRTREFNLSNGRQAEIKVMPETASERAIERLGQLNFTIKLKEVGNNQTAYELTSEKEGKMFGLFKIRGNVSIQVDAETGKVLKIRKPWWAFLATGI